MATKARYRVRWQFEHEGQWFDGSYETVAHNKTEAAFLAGIAANGFVSRPRRNLEVFRL